MALFACYTFFEQVLKLQNSRPIVYSEGAHLQKVCKRTCDTGLLPLSDRRQKWRGIGLSENAG